MRAATPAFVALLTVTACDTQPASVVAPHLYHDASQATGAGSAEDRSRSNCPCVPLRRTFASSGANR